MNIKKDRIKDELQTIEKRKSPNVIIDVIFKKWSNSTLGIFGFRYCSI